MPSEVVGQLLVNGGPVDHHAGLADALVHMHRAIMYLHHRGTCVMSLDGKFGLAAQSAWHPTQLCAHRFLINGDDDVSAAETGDVRVPFAADVGVTKQFLNRPVARAALREPDHVMI